MGHFFFLTAIIQPVSDGNWVWKSWEVEILELWKVFLFRPFCVKTTFERNWVGYEQKNNGTRISPIDCFHSFYIVTDNEKFGVWEGVYCFNCLLQTMVVGPKARGFMHSQWVPWPSVAVRELDAGRGNAAWDERWHSLHLPHSKQAQGNALQKQVQKEKKEENEYSFWNNKNGYSDKSQAISARSD